MTDLIQDVASLVCMSAFLRLDGNVDRRDVRKSSRPAGRGPITDASVDHKRQTASLARYGPLGKSHQNQHS
ncbi:hypothetical protein ACHMW4_03300 [Mesorhizobium sp. UC22_110]|uniref:hypothetical protein n=1 Tax=Mesorhizobium sp. UC22_110 TaxID=3374552 RepID=UPI0037569FF8